MNEKFVVSYFIQTRPVNRYFKTQEEAETLYDELARSDIFSALTMEKITTLRKFR